MAGARLIRVGGTEAVDRVGDVVFVHGLDGEPTDSWSRGPGTFWPAWLAEDCPDVGVWSIGYNVASSGWAGTAMSLFDRAVNILELLSVHGLGDRPICFITHSMGGLVVKKLVQEAHESLGEYRRFATAVRGVLFLATPHTGSDLAKLGTFLSFLRPSVAVEELRSSGPVLRDLNAWYRDHAGELGIRNKVYFENQRTKGVRIVDAASADPGISGVQPLAVDADHISICKPASRDELVYLGARKFVGEVLIRPQSSANAAADLDLTLRLDRVRRWTRRDRSGAMTFGTVAVSTGELAFGEGAYVQATIENRSVDAAMVSCFDVVVLEHDESFVADYPMISLRGMHLEVPLSKLAHPIRLDELAELDGGAAVTSTQIALDPTGSPTAHHTFDFGVVATVSGLWKLALRARHFAPRDPDQVRSTTSEPFYLVKR